jgi:hypothetical protein
MLSSALQGGKIMMRKFTGFFAAMVLCSGLTPAFAHHSGAMFDRTKTVELSGTIKEYQFANPHVWIEVMADPSSVKASGQPAPKPSAASSKKTAGASKELVQWSIEGEGPSIMARMGLGPSVLKAGDKITIKLHPLRDGRPGGSFIAITLADGKVIAPAKRP